MNKYCRYWGNTNKLYYILWNMCLFITSLCVISFVHASLFDYCHRIISWKFIYVWYIYINIRLKFKPNSVRTRFLSSQFFCSSLDGIWILTIDALQHHSLSLTSSALDHSTTSTPYINIYISHINDVRVHIVLIIYTDVCIS